jgi:predicted nucleic acid-binding protein
MNDFYHSSNVSVVVDNNVIIDLFELKQIPLLFEICEFVIIPKIIYDNEIPPEVKIVWEGLPFQLENITTTIGLKTYGVLVNSPEYKRLSTYDKIAISIAKETHYDCNSNDKPVRNACEKLGVKYTGVLGVLGRAYRRNSISKTELSFLLSQLESDETSCYISLRVIEQFRQDIFS